MDINVVGLGLGITDRFREYVTEKAEKISHLADRALALEVKVSRPNERSGAHSGDDRVEITLIGPGPVVRAEASGDDKYAAFDIAQGKLLARLRKQRDRKKVHRGGSKRPTSLLQATSSSFKGAGVVPAPPAAFEGAVAVDAAKPDLEDGEYSPVVIRRKVFASSPMNVDDALYFMELVGHDFYLFMDRESNRPSVVYRRKGWDYGVISIGDDDDET